MTTLLVFADGVAKDVRLFEARKVEARKVVEAGEVKARKHLISG